MQDKNENSKNRELKRVNLDEAFKNEVFPTRQPSTHETFTFVVQDEILCYICMDTPPGNLTALHVYIPPEKRSYENILELKEGLYDFLHPWCRSEGYDNILFSCDGSDTKTTELAITMGFNPANINMAMMPVI